MALLTELPTDPLSMSKNNARVRRVNIYHVLRGIGPTLSRPSFSEGGRVRILAEERKGDSSSLPLFLVDPSSLRFDAASGYWLMVDRKHCQ